MYAVLRKLLICLVALSACTQSAAPSTTGSVVTTTTSGTSTTTAAVTTTTQGEIAMADIILHNGQVVTVDSQSTVASALAIAGGDITVVGDDVTVFATAGPETLVVDLEGRTVIPGFVDPHTHLLQAPAPDLDLMREAQLEMLTGGTTTAGMPSVEPDELAAFQELAEGGELIVRTHLYVLYNSACGDRPFGEFYLENEFTQDPSLELAIAGVKVFADGGVCQAPAVSFEYPQTVPQGLKDSGWVDNGDLYIDAAEFESVVSEIDGLGGQVVTHAIGDVAIRTALEGLAGAADGGLELRHRIEHNSMASLLPREELELYGQARVTPIIQLMPWAAACEEGRSELWASILPEPAYSSIEDRTPIARANQGIEFAWHGDNPWVPGHPLQQMFSVVTGGAVDAASGEICYPEAWDWFPTVSIEEALRLMTINAARAMLIDNRVGSLEAGKTADLLILAEDIFHDDPEIGIAGNRPILTMIGGQVAHCEGDLCEPFSSESGTKAPPLEDGWSAVDHPVVAAVRASAERSPAPLAVDANPDTGWVAGEGPVQWIELDVGAIRTITGMRLLVDQDPSGPTVHRIYAGAESSPSQLVIELSGDTAWGDELAVTGPFEARYIRVETVESPSWVAWLEIEVEADG